MRTFKQFLADRRRHRDHVVHKGFFGNQTHPEDDSDEKPAPKEKDIKEGYFNLNQRGKERLKKVLNPDEKVKYPEQQTKSNNLRNTLLKHTENNDQLDAGHKMAIAHYTDEGYLDINRHLYRSGKIPNNEVTRKSGLGKYDRDLSDAISTSKSPRNFHAFAGIRSPEALPRSHDGRIHMKSPAYSSTSLNPSIAKDFGSRVKHDGTSSEHIYDEDRKPATQEKDEQGHTVNASGTKAYKHIARIHIPKDSHGLYVHPHSSISVAGDKDTVLGEHEYLLHKGSRVSFHPKPKVDHDTKTIIWHGRLEHDGLAPTRHSKSETPQKDLFDKKRKVKNPVPEPTPTKLKSHPNDFRQTAMHKVLDHFPGRMGKW